jgi:hypothetical protein
VAGAGVLDTVTVTDLLALPPAPVQVSVNVVSAVMAAEVSVPEIALLPVQPLEAVQLVALLVDHCKDVVPEALTEPGVALKVMVGSGGVLDRS